MSVLSTVSCALLSAATAFTIVTAAGCGTDAKGVDDCREIEEARCSAAKNCDLIKDVSECQNFYRDQCLHGLAVSPPGSTQIKSCVATIRAAGLCALQATDTAPSDCTNAPSSETSATTTCEIVTNPELTSECSFLKPDADAGTGGSGGGGGGASDSDGSAATAGSDAATDTNDAAGAAN